MVLSFSKDIIDRFLFWSLFIIGLPVTIYASTGLWPEDKSSQQVTPSQEIAKETIRQDEISVAVFDMKGIGISKIAVKSNKITQRFQTSNDFSAVVSRISPTVIPNPTTSAIQRGRIQYSESKTGSNSWQIQTKSFSNKLLSGLGGKSGMLIGGTVLSYLVVKGLVTLVSQSSHGEKISEIGIPPSFPEVSPPSGI